EFQFKGIPFVEQQALTLSYKGYQLKQVYKPDFICFQNIIVEIKALKDTGDEHRAQLLNYLKATNAKVGLLVNFGHYPKATIERFVN
ncbi:MAG: GxxExxY protein, partial [Lentisphaeraceae bacterium]|nr:GxxExxY protein [Lentisphaeraceae bacterium]